MNTVLVEALAQEIYEVIDGRWVIDAGPEKGTLMKTQNGQTNGNIQGVYNNLLLVSQQIFENVLNPKFSIAN